MTDHRREASKQSIEEGTKTRDLLVCESTKITHVVDNSQNQLTKHIDSRMDAQSGEMLSGLLVTQISVEKSLDDTSAKTVTDIADTLEMQHFVTEFQTSQENARTIGILSSQIAHTQAQIEGLSAIQMQSQMHESRQMWESTLRPAPTKSDFMTPRRTDKPDRETIEGLSPQAKERANESISVEKRVKPSATRSWDPGIHLQQFRPEQPSTRQGRSYSGLEFKKVPRDRRKEFFTTGRVFAAKAEWQGRVFRRFVLVERSDSDGIVLPISTYDGQGLALNELSRRSIDAHAIILIAGQPANKLKGEPPSVKEPLTVRTSEHSDLNLSPAIRLCFNKPETLSLKWPVLNIGKLEESSVHRLLHYWGEHRKDGMKYMSRQCGTVIERAWDTATQCSGEQPSTSGAAEANEKTEGGDINEDVVVGPSKADRSPTSVSRRLSQRKSDQSYSLMESQSECQEAIKEFEDELDELLEQMRLRAPPSQT
jgi:hypothetical protein